MIPIVHRSCLALLCASSFAHAQLVLDGTYSFGTLRAEFDTGCPAGSQVLAEHECGTLSFAATGTFSITSDGTSICLAGVFSTGSSTETGTYTLDDEGSLELDFDPANPGTDVTTLFLSPDRQILLEQLVEPGVPNIALGVRQSTGLSNADLNGDYSVCAVRQSILPSGLEILGLVGSLQFDGVGGWSNVVSGRLLDSTGASTLVNSTDSGTITVAANGQLFEPGTASAVGQLSADGNFGFLMDPPGSDGWLTMFVRKKGAPPTPNAVDDDWFVSAYGGNNEDPSGEVELEDATGDLQLDASAGSYSFVVDSDWVSNLGPGGAGGVETGTAVVAPTGALTLTDTGSPTSSEGWLAAGERVALVATISEQDYTGVGIALRVWGSLSTDTDTISVGAGGSQVLEIRATDEFAGKPYLVLGSTMGIHPGLPWGGTLVPLNYSAYMLFSLNNANVAPFANTFGVLDADGRATASITMPPGTYASAAGATLHSALIVFDPPGFGSVVHVSKPIPLALLP